MKHLRCYAASFAALGALMAPLGASEVTATATSGLKTMTVATVGQNQAPAALSATSRDPSYGSIAGLAAAIQSRTGGVDALLGSLGGGPLTLALFQAAREGRRERLLLDPQDADSREQGALLAALTPTAQVRWGGPFRYRRRWMLMDAVEQVAWYPGGIPVGITASAALGHFERAWDLAGRSLSPELYLRDQLNALP